MSRMKKYAEGIKQELGIPTNTEPKDTEDFNGDFLEPNMDDFGEPNDGFDGFDGSFESDFGITESFEEPEALEDGLSENDAETQESEDTEPEENSETEITAQEPDFEEKTDIEEKQEDDSLPLDIPDPNVEKDMEMPFEMPEPEVVEEMPKKKSGRKKKSEITGTPGQPDVPMLLVPEGAEIVGNITSAIAVEIYGSVNGDIVSPDAKIHGIIDGNIYSPNIYADSPNIKGNIYCNEQLRIGENAVVTGDIEAKSVIVAGTVRGNITTSGLTVITDTAQITGNIKTKSLQIAAGAVVRGTCNLGYE